MVRVRKTSTRNEPGEALRLSIAGMHLGFFSILKNLSPFVPQKRDYSSGTNPAVQSDKRQSSPKDGHIAHDDGKRLRQEIGGAE